MATNPNISFAPLAKSIPRGELNINPAMIENIRSIISPNQVLEEKQQALIQQISQFKTEELSGAIATKAASDIDVYRSEAMNMLKQNKGTRRLNFTPEQQAELVAKKRKMEQDINYGTQQLKSFDNTLNKAMQMMHYDMLSEDDIKQVVGWSDRVKKTLSEGKSIADIPDHQAELAQLLSAKPQKEVEQKQLNTFWETILNPIQDRYFRLPKDEIRSLFETQVSGAGAWDKTRKMHEALGYVSPTDTDETAKNKIIGILEKRWKPRKYPVSGGGDKTVYTITPEDGSWDVGAAGVLYTGSVDGTPIKDGKVSRIFIDDDGKYKMGVVVKEGGSGLFGGSTTTEKVTNLSDVVVENLKKKKFSLEGLSFPNKTEKKTESKSTTKVYIGSNGKEYTEDQLSRVNIQRAIKDGKLKVK